MFTGGLFLCDGSIAVYCFLTGDFNRIVDFCENVICLLQELRPHFREENISIHSRLSQGTLPQLFVQP